MSYCIILNLKKNQPQQCQLESFSGDYVKPGFTLLDKQDPAYKSIKQAFLHANDLSFMQKKALRLAFKKGESFQYKLADFYFTLHQPHSDITGLSPFMRERYDFLEEMVEKVPTPHAHLAFLSIAKHTNNDFETLQQIEQGKIWFKIHTLQPLEAIPDNAIFPVQGDLRESEQIMEQHFNSWNNRFLKIRQIPHSVLQLANMAVNYNYGNIKNTLTFLEKNPAILVNLALITRAFLFPLAAATSVCNNGLFQTEGELNNAITEDFKIFETSWYQNDNDKKVDLLGKYIEDIQKIITEHSSCGNQNLMMLKQFKKHFNQLQKKTGVSLIQPYLNEYYNNERYVDFMIKSVGMDIDYIYPNGATLLSIMCANSEDYPLANFKKVLALGANPNAVSFPTSPMFQCLPVGRQEVIKLLIEHGGKLIGPEHNLVAAALMVRRMDIAEWLLREYAMAADFGISQQYIMPRDFSASLVQKIPILAAVHSRNIQYLNLLFEYNLQAKSLILITEHIYTIILANKDHTMSQAILEKIADHDEEMAFNWLNKTLNYLPAVHEKGFYIPLLRHFQTISKNEKIKTAVTDKLYELEASFFTLVVRSAWVWLFFPLIYSVVKYFSKDSNKQAHVEVQEKYIAKQLKKPKDPVKKPLKIIAKPQEKPAKSPEELNQETLVTLDNLFLLVTSFEACLPEEHTQLKVMVEKMSTLPVPDKKLHNILQTLGKLFENNSLDYLSKIKTCIENAQRQIQQYPDQIVDIGNMSSQVENLAGVKRDMKKLREEAQNILNRKTTNISTRHQVIQTPVAKHSQGKRKKTAKPATTYSILPHSMDNSSQSNLLPEIPQILPIKSIEYIQKPTFSEPIPESQTFKKMRKDQRIVQLGQIVQTLKQAIYEKQPSEKMSILYEISHGLHAYDVLKDKIPNGKKVKQYRNTLLHYFEHFYTIDVLNFAKIFLNTVESPVNSLVTGEGIKDTLSFAELERQYPDLFISHGNDNNSVDNNLKLLGILNARMQEYKHLEESLGDKFEFNRVLQSAIISCFLQIRKLRNRFKALEENPVFANLTFALSGSWIKQTNQAAHFQYTDDLFAEENTLLEIETMNHLQLRYELKAFCQNLPNVTKCIIGCERDLIQKERAANPAYLNLNMFNRETMLNNITPTPATRHSQQAEF